MSGRNDGTVLDDGRALRAAGHRVTVLFLDARTPTSCGATTRRGASTRWPPRPTASSSRSPSSASCSQGTRDAADLVIDTSELNVHQLKERLVVGVRRRRATSRLQVAVESFGFKHGLPLDADIVMDVRFLPNPHWEEQLRPLTGHDPAVRDFVLERADTDGVPRAPRGPARHASCRRTRPRARSYLTIAIGCTGGRHRSVAIAEELARRLRARGTAGRARPTATSPADRAAVLERRSRSGRAIPLSAVG